MGSNKKKSNSVSTLLCEHKIPLHSMLDQSLNATVWKKTWDPQNLKVDPLEGPKQPPLKSPLVDHTKKIFQSRFGILMQLIFLCTIICCTTNKKWFLCKNYYFLFTDQIWKMPLSHIAKNGPKTQFHLRLPFFFLGQDIKSDFFMKKIIFSFLSKWKKWPFWVKLSFWPIFGNMAQRHFPNLASKQKVIIFA